MTEAPPRTYRNPRPFPPLPACRALTVKNTNGTGADLTGPDGARAQPAVCVYVCVTVGTEECGVYRMHVSAGQRFKPTKYIPVCTAAALLVGSSTLFFVFT